MIKTKYNISLEIDEEKIKVLYVNPSMQKQEEFKKAFEQYNTIIEELQDKQSEIEFLETQISINTDVIASLEDNAKKLKVLEEQRKNINTLRKLKDELKNLGKKEIDLNDLAKKRFAVTIAGEQKETLIKIVEEKSISYYELMEEIDKEVLKAKEKK